MTEKYPTASEIYHVSTDTYGSIATVSATGEVINNRLIYHDQCLMSYYIVSIFQCDIWVH